MRLLRGVLNVRVDQQAVHLAVDVLDRDLEAVETSRLRQLDLAAEVARQVLRGKGREGKGREAGEGRQEKGREVRRGGSFVRASGVELIFTYCRERNALSQLMSNSRCSPNGDFQP